jgi:hypothetical protein
LNRQINQIATTAGKLFITLLTIAGTNLILLENRCVNAVPVLPSAAEPELEINVVGNQRLNLPKSTPIYTIESQQIGKDRKMSRMS